MFRQIFVDFTVTRNRLTGVDFGILIPIVFSPVTQEYTTHTFYLPNEIASFHAIRSSPTRRGDGTAPEERS